MTAESHDEAIAEAQSFQARVSPWMLACFGAEISSDIVERGDRLLEEVLELLQSGKYDFGRVASLRDYVAGRPAGEPSQEVGGVMVTLAAYCLAVRLNMHEAGETELARVWTKVEKIRAKQAAKPKHSPLPAEMAAGGGAGTAGMRRAAEIAASLGSLMRKMAATTDAGFPRGAEDLKYLAAARAADDIESRILAAIPAAPAQIAPPEIDLSIGDEQDEIEAATLSLNGGRFLPSMGLSISGGVDTWREIMKVALRAAKSVRKPPAPAPEGEIEAADDKLISEQNIGILLDDLTEAAREWGYWQHANSRNKCYKSRTFVDDAIAALRAAYIRSRPAAEPPGCQIPGAAADAEREACATIAGSFAGKNRYSVSDTWREEMTPSEVFETAANDVSAWIEAEIRARAALSRLADAKGEKGA